MAQKFYNESDIQAIASAIRAKNGLSSTYTVSQMASAIQNIPSGSGGGGNTDMEDSLVTRALSTYENSRVTSIGNNAFQECSRLTSVSFPQTTNIGSNAFQGCIALTSVSFPQTTNIGNNAFQGCYSLVSVSLGGEQSQSGRIYYSCFRSCFNLVSLKLSGGRGRYFYSLLNSNAFTSTPIGGYSASAGQYGSIYVPDGLYSQYISATNWAYFSNRIVSYAEPIL